MGTGIIGYLFYIGTLWIVSLFFIEYSALQVFYISIFVIVLVIACCAWMTYHLQVTVKPTQLFVEKRTTKGVADCRIQVKMTNSSRLFSASKVLVKIGFVNTLTGEKGKKKVYCSANANAEQVNYFYVQMRTSGYVTLTVKKILVYDLFHIFSLRKRVKDSSYKIIVLPVFEREDILRDENFGNRIMCEDSYSPYLSGDDPSEILAIREYKDGDKLQNIHWKLSAKVNSLMVKERPKHINKSIDIYVDFDWTGSAQEKHKHWEQLIMGVYSFTLFLLENEYPVKYAWYDEKNDVLSYETIDLEEELLYMMYTIFSSQEGIVSKNLWTLIEQSEQEFSGGFFLTTRTKASFSDSLINSENVQLVMLDKEGVCE